MELELRLLMCKLWHCILSLRDSCVLMILSSPHGWRYMVGLGGVPAILLACLLPFCPESPRQLIYHGKIAEAEIVLGKIYNGASPDQVRAKAALIAVVCEEAKDLNEDQSRWSKIKQLHTNPAYFRALVCACGLMVISQMSGFNTLMYYSSTLFALVGFSNPVAVGLVVSGTNFVVSTRLQKPYISSQVADT